MLSVLDDTQYRQLAAVATTLNMGILTEVSTPTEMARAVALGARRSASITVIYTISASIPGAPGISRRWHRRARHLSPSPVSAATPKSAIWAARCRAF